jgi:type I restriction enzyme S subunit
MLSNWKKYKLKDVTSKIGSGSTPRGGDSSYISEGISLIRSQNVLDFTFSTQGLAYINEEQAHELRSVSIQKNDILVNITGDSVARVCQVPNEIIPARVNQHVAILRANPDLLNSKFLKYFLLQPSSKNNLLSLSSSGATRKALTKTMLEEFEINLPDAKEQEAIVEILSSLDDKIELNLQTNKTLDEMANALYKHWFIDFGPFKDGKLIESELGMIPEGFAVQSFKDVCFNHSKTFDFKGMEKVIFVNTGDILEGKFLHTNYSEVETLPGQAKKAIEIDDILFSEIRPGNKRYAIINFDASEYVVSTKFMVVRSNGNILPRILYRILRDEKIIKEFQFIAESRSGTFPQITFDSISHISFVNSNLSVQKDFMKSVLPLENLIESNNSEIEQLKQTRDYLLPKLIKGEVRVKQALKKVKEII